VAQEICHAIDALAKQLRKAGAHVEVAPLLKLDFNDELAMAGELTGMMGVAQPEKNKPTTTLAQYFEALQKRDESIIAWEQFFDQWDALLCPASMTTAFPHCETGAPLDVDGQKVEYWTISAHAVPFNYTGHPAVVLPYTQDRDGLPIGVQLVGKRWHESRLLAVAKAVAEVTDEFRRPAGY